MKRLLAPEHRDVLIALASSRTLLAFDFDGTLAPLVDDRDGAVTRPRTAALFAQVCVRYPCAVISGRRRADVTARLGGAAVKYVVGNHGLEPGAGLATFARDAASARTLLEHALAGVAGVDIEDKRFSLALHYRRSDTKRSTRAAILRAIASLTVPLRVVPGKLVVNVVPMHAPNKGDALLHLQAEEGATRALFVGDDVTDEDIFDLDQPDCLVTVRIGASTASRAMYYLRNQAEIDVLLAALIALRTGNVAPGAAAGGLA